LNAINSGTAFWALVVVTAVLILILAVLHLARYKQKPKRLLRKIEWLRTFYVWLGALAILGGTWAFFLPIALNSGFNKDDDGPVLRQLLIYTVGGLLGVITLGETHRKNTLEKTKNEQDHIRQVHAEIRQVHAERRSRYTTAIEQLSSDKASIRLGGIYSLVGLVDEWLADEKTTPSLEERRKEGQVIINNLCAYIRSPFPLAERAEQLDKPYAKDLQNDFGGDKEKFDADKRSFAQEKAALEEERQVRQSIIKEIYERLRNINEPGSWSDFDYDFSNAHFFYYVDFSDSIFGAFAKFSEAIFAKDADFSGAIFAEFADFSRSTFAEFADFSRSTFAEFAGFFSATFTRNADFSRSAFTRNAYFFWTTFAKDANFSWTTFAKDANFSKAKFIKDANFSWTTFEDKPIFEYTINNKTYKARFSYKVNPEDYNFEVSHGSPYKIETEEQEYNGVKFIIPKGTELFDPDEPSDLEDDDES